MFCVLFYWYYVAESNWVSHQKCCNQKVIVGSRHGMTYFQPVFRHAPKASESCVKKICIYIARSTVKPDQTRTSRFPEEQMFVCLNTFTSCVYPTDPPLTRVCYRAVLLHKPFFFSLSNVGQLTGVDCCCCHTDFSEPGIWQIKRVPKD